MCRHGEHEQEGGGWKGREGGGGRGKPGVGMEGELLMILMAGMQLGLYIWTTVCSLAHLASLVD